MYAQQTPSAPANAPAPTRPGRRPRALHFGAGNIGRGFIAPLLVSPIYLYIYIYPPSHTLQVDSGYHVVFADVDKSIIEELNEKQEYEVHILDHETDEVKVTHVSATLSYADDLIDRISRSETRLITTAVGLTILDKIAPTIAKGIHARRTADSAPLNVIACENAIGATKKLQALVEEHLDDADRAYVAEKVG